MFHLWGGNELPFVRKQLAADGFKKHNLRELAASFDVCRERVPFEKREPTMGKFVVVRSCWLQVWTGYEV